MFHLKSERVVLLSLFLIIGILLGLRQCTPKSIESVLNQTKETFKWETVNRPYKIVEFKTKYYPKWDSIKNTDTVWANVGLCDITRFYNDSLVDSNLTIYTNNEVIGIIEESKTSYRLKVPLKIIETHTFVNTIIKPTKFDVFAISGLGGNLTKFNMSLGLAVRYNKVYYGATYGILDKTYNLNIGYKIFSKKK